jgi:hypothetical protein
VYKGDLDSALRDVVTRSCRLLKIHAGFGQRMQAPAESKAPRIDSVAWNRSRRVIPLN